MHAGIIFFLVILGSILFHIFTPWYWTDIASNWKGMDDTITLTFWVGGGVFVAVCLFMIYCVFKYSYKEDRKAEYKPEDKKLEKILTVATTLGVAALLAPGLIIWNQYVNVPKNSIEIDVMAWQWGWQYRLPGNDGKLGTTKVVNINDDNPFGINLDDPYGRDDVMVQSDIINLENNRPVKILLRSVDVLHNWYVPQFRAKMDAVPGVVTYYWFEPNKVGEYEVLCAEYCGVGHYAMRGGVEVQDPNSYQEWLGEQETFSDLLAKQNKEIETKKVAKNNSNIEKVINYTGFDLHTEVINWDDMKRLQIAYLKSGISNQDVPQDHIFFSTLYHYSIKHKINYSISGGNIATESILPDNWHGSAMDSINLKSIFKTHGTGKLLNYKTISFFQYFLLYPILYNLKTNDKNVFCFGPNHERKYPMEAGKAYIINTHIHHGTLNEGTTERAHILARIQSDKMFDCLNLQGTV